MAYVVVPFPYSGTAPGVPVAWGHARGLWQANGHSCVASPCRRKAADLDGISHFGYRGRWLAVKVHGSNA